MLTLVNSRGESKSYSYQEVKEIWRKDPYQSHIYGPLEGLGDAKDDWVEAASIPTFNGIWDEEEHDYVFCEPYWDDEGWYTSICKMDVFKEGGDIKIEIGHNFDGQYHRDWGNNPVGYNPLASEKDKKRRNKFIRRRFRKMDKRKTIKELLKNSFI